MLPVRLIKMCWKIKSVEPTAIEFSKYSTVYLFISKRLYSKTSDLNKTRKNSIGTLSTQLCRWRNKLSIVIIMILMIWFNNIDRWHLMNKKVSKSVMSILMKFS